MVKSLLANTVHLAHMHILAKICRGSTRIISVLLNVGQMDVLAT